MDQRAKELMETSYRYLFRLSEGISDEVQKRRTGNIKDLSVINQIAEGIQFLMQSVALTTDYDTLDKESNIYKKVDSAFNELSNALKNNDPTLITDVLEHEFLPILEEWKALFFNILADAHEAK